jgi:XTP/dITP diphosphohydrolase
MRLLLATTNRDKVREYRQLLKGFNLKAVKHLPPVAENGRTFSDNAILKAKAYGSQFGELTFCDDTGLEIKALGGFPGLNSHRFAAEGFPKARKELLKRLKNIPESERQARFICVIALYLPGSGKVRTFTGIVSGRIALKETGSRGFGYDPIFLVPRVNKTFSQMGMRQKNLISHRGLATRKLKAYLVKLAGDVNKF